MRRSKLPKTICLILAAVLILPLFSTLHAQEQTIKINQPQRLGSVELKSNVQAEINNLVMIPSDNGQLVGFTLTVHNNSNSELDFIDYWVDLYTKAGTKFSISAAATNVSKIPAKSTRDLVFYSNVSANVKASDLVFNIIKWDFSYDDFKKVLGKVTVSQNYTAVTPANEGRVVSAGESRISTHVKRANIGKSEKYYRPDIKLAIKNEGKQTITLPDYEIAIVTKDGLLYPLTARNLKGTVLSPLSDKEIQLTASIPVEVNQDDWKLVIINPMNDGKIRVPVALFELPKTSLDGSGDLGKYYTFSTMDGVYNIKLNSLNRLPLEDNDLIIANLTIANPGTDTLPIPNLAAKYVLNESIEKAGTMSINNKVISIAPGQSIDLQAVTSVPYTFDITKVELTIQQKDSEGGQVEDVMDLVQFSHQGAFTPVPVIEDVYVNNELGYRSNVSIRNVYTFEGSTANIIAAEVMVENLEKRQSEIQKFAGYFEKTDGTIYPAIIQQISDKVYPGGKAIFYAYATVPKSFGFDDVQLVIGKAVESVAGETATLIGYVNPNAFVLPAEQEAQQSLQNIDVAPYQLSIKRVATQANFQNSQIILEFDYDLQEDLLVKHGMKERTIVVELEDAGQKVVLNRELKIVGAEGSADSNTLKVGKHTVRLDPWQDDKVVQIDTFKEFNLNVYIQIEPGYKKLIATQKLPWLVNRTLSD